MSKAEIPFGNRLQAQALSIGSAVVQTMPTIRDYIGGAPALSYAPARWRFDGTAVSQIHNWIHVPGTASDAINPSQKPSGRTPKNYQEVAIIAANESEMEELLQVPRTRPAVAYALGEAVMVGVLPQGRGFARYNSEALVAMRLGAGELQASMGGWRPQTKSFVPVETPLRLDERLPITSAPVVVPIV